MLIRSSSGRLLAATLIVFVLPAYAASWPQPPLPPDTNVADVSKQMVYNGVDMRAQIFQSTVSAEQVVDFYKKKWGKEAILNSIGDAQVVGHQEGDYLVTVQVNGYGAGSKGTIGIMDTKSSKPDFVPGKGLPQPMGSLVFNDISYPNDPVRARTVAMRNDLSPQQNANFYRERLAADGWKPADRNQCTPDSCVMYYNRGDSKMTVVMTPGEGKSQVVINVMDPP